MLEWFIPAVVFSIDCMSHICDYSSSHRRCTYIELFALQNPSKSVCLSALNDKLSNPNPPAKSLQVVQWDLWSSR